MNQRPIYPATTPPVIPARYISFGDHVINLYAVQVATLHRSEGWLEIRTAGQSIIVDGRARAQAIWHELLDTLVPQQWPWPEENGRALSDRSGCALRAGASLTDLRAMPSGAFGVPAGALAGPRAAPPRPEKPLSPSYPSPEPAKRGAS